MPEKILLISCNTCTSPYPVYPLGMSHVAASLRRYGHEVTLADLRYDDARIEEIVQKLHLRCIGLSLRNIDDQHIEDTAFFVPVLFSTVRRLRQTTDAVIVLGGSAYSLFPEELLVESDADYGIVGEGDEAMAQLIAELAEKDNGQSAKLAAVPGLVYREETGIQRNPPAPLDGKAILPSYRPKELFSAYLDDSGVASIQTQRGCPYSCCYCTYPVIEGAVVRKRDPQEIANEAAALEAAGARYFFIVDSVFNLNGDHIAAVCEALLGRNLTMSWGCFLRPANIAPDLMRLMARAGLRHIEFGTDSLCDKVLDAYGKKFTVEEVIAADNLADACGVRHAHFLICGGPGETESTLEESWENATRLKRTVVFPYVGMRLYPGTALHTRALQEGCVTASTDLLHPFFYVTQNVRKERIEELLETFHQRSPRWIVREPTPEEIKIIERLRRKSVAGPLWEFLAQ